MCQNVVTVSDVHGKHRIRQSIHNDALKLNYVVCCKDYSASLVLTFEFLNKYGQIPA